MKKFLKWFIFILVISGWIAFGIVYGIFKKEKAELNARITQLQSEITSYKYLMKDIEKSKEEIENIVSTLGDLKIKLEKLQKKMEKGEKK